MADVSVDQRQLLYNDIISSVKDLEESKRSEALSQLGGSFDIRTGVLALQVLAVVKPTCHAAFCIPELASATDPFEKFAAANKHLIIDEQRREAKARDLRIKWKDEPVVNDVVFILDDPSRRATFGLGPRNKSIVTAYVRGVLPSDRAKLVIDAYAVGFDLSRIKFSPKDAPPPPPSVEACARHRIRSQGEYNGCLSQCDANHDNSIGKCEDAGCRGGVDNARNGCKAACSGSMQASRRDGCCPECH